MCWLFGHKWGKILAIRETKMFNPSFWVLEEERKCFRCSLVQRRIVWNGFEWKWRKV